MLQTLIVVLGAAWAGLWGIYALAGLALHFCLLPLHIERWLDRRRAR